MHIQYPRFNADLYGHAAPRDRINYSSDDPELPKYSNTEHLSNKAAYGSFLFLLGVSQDIAELGENIHSMVIDHQGQVRNVRDDARVQIMRVYFGVISNTKLELDARSTT